MNDHPLSGPALLQRFHALDSFLIEHQALWRPRPFTHHPALPWEASYPELTAWLSARSLEQAEAAAQETLVKDVKAAEAAEQAARHRAVEMTVLADAELQAAGTQAEAKRVLADGVRAESAAPGLAEAQVREANAVAMEKTGLAEARYPIYGEADVTVDVGQGSHGQAVDAIHKNLRRHWRQRRRTETPQ